ncbi:MAG: transcriptional regulator, PucR family [Conexibacter sp.]|nr:transcriptional regulator, PucR family [Conexibacter sp.]
MARPDATPPDHRDTPAVPRVRITVADALALPVLRRGMPDVVAGRDLLDRPIRWVHAGEVPNIASLLTGGELLLTTGMGLGTRAAEQRRFVADLTERGIAALVIELGAVFAELPEPLVQAATTRALPLIALRREVAFVAVTEAIHTEIVNAQYALLRRGDDVQRELMHVLLDGGGIPDVLRVVAELLGNPVYLEDADGRLLFHAAVPASGARDDALGGWEAARSGAGRGAWAAALAAPVPLGGDGGAARGRLLALPLAGPLDETARIPLARAADIVALALLRARQEEELLARERGNFLLDLASGRLGAVDAERQARAMGFGAGERLLPLAAVSAADATRTAAPIAAGAWDLVVADAQEAIDRHGHAALLGTHGPATALLGLVAVRASGQREGDGRAAAAGVAAAAIRAAVQRRLGPGPGGGDVVVVAGELCGWEEAPPALALAAETAASAVGLDATPWHDVRALELHRLLWHWRDDAELAAFVRRTLGPLAAHDRQRTHHLMPTLQALCAHGGHKAETARALHLNRQALYNRLARIEELLGVDLSDPDQLLTLQLALRARDVVR